MTFHVTVERESDGSDEIESGLEPFLEDPEVEVSYLADDRGPELEPEDLQGADAYISYSYDLTADSLEGVETLKIVSRTGAGYDNLDIDALSEHGVIVTHAPEGPTASAAQSAVGMIIACAHNFPGYEYALREQGWAGRSNASPGFELQNATLGFIGMGLIGQEVLDNLTPFREKGLETLVYDPYMPDAEADELGVEKVDLETLLSTSDIVTIHAPLTDETHHMLGAEEFEKMQDSAYLVNTSRGGFYPDEELARALREDQLAGAAIDVFEDEPNVEGNPLLDIGDIQVTPHVSGPTTDAVRRMRRHSAESIMHLKNGDYPTNVLNPEVYERVYGEKLPDEYVSPAFQA